MLRSGDIQQREGADCAVPLRARVAMPTDQCDWWGGFDSSSRMEAMTLTQGIGKSGLRPVFAVLLLLAGGAIERANAQSNAAAASAQGGPTTDQLFDEAVGKADEFDAFGWPARGRFTLTPRLIRNVL